MTPSNREHARSLWKALAITPVERDLQKKAPGHRAWSHPVSRRTK